MSLKKSIFDDPGKLQGRRSKSTSNPTKDWLNSVPAPSTKRKVKKKTIKTGAKAKFQSR